MITGIGLSLFLPSFLPKSYSTAERHLLPLSPSPPPLAHPWLCFTSLPKQYIGSYSCSLWVHAGIFTTLPWLQTRPWKCHFPWTRMYRFWEYNQSLVQKQRSLLKNSGCPLAGLHFSLDHLPDEGTLVTQEQLFLHDDLLQTSLLHTVQARYMHPGFWASLDIKPHTPKSPHRV